MSRARSSVARRQFSDLILTQQYLLAAVIGTSYRPGGKQTRNLRSLESYVVKSG